MSDLFVTSLPASFPRTGYTIEIGDGPSQVGRAEAERQLRAGGMTREGATRLINRMVHQQAHLVDRHMHARLFGSSTEGRGARRPGRLSYRQRQARGRAARQGREKRSGRVLDLDSA